MSAISTIVPRPADSETLATALHAADQRYLDRLHAHLEASAIALREELYLQLKATVSHQQVSYEGPRAVARVGGYRFTVDHCADALPLLRVEVLCPGCGERGWSQVVIGYEGLAEAVRTPSVSQHFCDHGVAW